MTSEEREMFTRIREYADEALKDFDTDPQKTPISFQLQKLRPVMQEIAMEKRMSVEDVFIKYMDLASEDAVEREKQFQESLDGDSSFSGRANQIPPSTCGFCPLQYLSLFFYATAFALICSITFLIPIQTFKSVKISATLPLSVNGASCRTDISFINPLWTIYSTIWFTK